MVSLRGLEGFGFSHASLKYVYVGPQGSGTYLQVLANMRHGRADIRVLGLGFRIRDLGFRVSKQTMVTHCRPLLPRLRFPLIQVI